MEAEPDLRDFFGRPVKVGDRVAYSPGSDIGTFKAPRLGTIKAIRKKPYGDRLQFFATIEREVSLPPRVVDGRYETRTKMADHEFCMDGRPLFLAPPEA